MKLDLKLLITIVFIISSLITYNSHQPFWFDSLHKPEILDERLLLWMMIGGYVILYLLWITHPEIEPYVLMLMCLNFVWFLFFFGVSNYRVSMISLTLSGIVLAAMLSRTIYSEFIYWIYSLILLFAFWYNIEIFILNAM